MFLTTLPHAADRRYTIIGTVSATIYKLGKYEVGEALEDMQKKAQKMGADGILGIVISTAPGHGGLATTALGTAVKFL